MRKGGYKAKGVGIYTRPAAFKIRVSANGTYLKYTVVFPTHGGPFYFNRVKEFALEWNGKLIEGPFKFIDSTGREITYDNAPTCDFSQPGVNQAMFPIDVGETGNELKILYQNVTENETITITEPESGYSITTNADPLKYLNVDITDVHSENSLFYAEIYSDLVKVGPYDWSVPISIIPWVTKSYHYEAAFGPKIKIEYYCNSPLTLMGDQLYSKQEEFTGICYGDEGRFILYNSKGEEVTGKSVRELLDMREDVLNAKYDIEILEGEGNVDIYFSSKGSSAPDKHSTSIDTDTIKGVSTLKEYWSTFYGENLISGYIYGKDYIFPTGGSVNSQSITINYNAPTDVVINTWQVELVKKIGDEYVLNNNVRIESLVDNSFDVVLNDQYQVEKLIEISGNISSPNFKKYQLEFIGQSGLRGIIKKNVWIDETNPQSLGVWDITGIPEGSYRLILIGINKDGSAKIDTKDITINELLNVMLNVTPEPGESFSPDYELANINLTISEDSIVTVNVKDSVSSTIVNTIINNQELNFGSHKFNWDGRDDSGNIVPDKDYIIEVIVKDKETDNSGVPLQVITETATVTVFFINKPLELEVKSSDIYITPDGNGINDTVKITYNISEKANIELKITNENLGLIKTTGVVLKDEGSYEYIWDGKDNSQNYVQPGEYKVEIVAIADDDNTDINTKQITIKVLETEIDNNIALTSPIDGEVVNSTPGVIYSYKAVAYGNYYPPVEANWQIRRLGRSFWSNHIQDSCRVNVNVNRNYKWTGKKANGYCTACAPNIYKYKVKANSATSHASKSVSYRYGCYRMKVHVWADAFSHHWGNYTLTVYGYQLRWDDWTRYVNSSEPLLVSNEHIDVFRLLPLSHPNPQHTYKSTVSRGSYHGYRYSIYSDKKNFLLSTTTYKWINGKVYGGFRIKSNYYEDWNSGIAVPFVKEFNSVVFDVSEAENKYEHDISQDLGYSRPANVIITGWDVELISDSSAVKIDPDDISPVNGLISGEGKFSVLLDKTKEKRYLTITGALGNDVVSYSLKYTEGNDLSNCEWKEIYTSAILPSDDVLAKWDVTYLYGLYTILLSVEKSNGKLVENVYSIRLGNVVTRENGGLAQANRTATSPYMLAELGFPPYSIPATAEDVNPATPELEVLVDILPTPSDDVQTDSSEKEVIGPVYDMLPRGMKFDKPVTLKYKYQNIDLIALGITNESRFAIYHVKDDGTIEYLPGYIDKANKVVTIQINEFSKFTLVYDRTIVPKPEFIGLPARTKEETLNLIGKADKDCKVNIYLDSEFKGEAEVNTETGDFVFHQLKLKFGQNKISAIAINKHNIISDTNTIIVIQDYIPPELFRIYDERNFEILRGVTNKNKIFFSPNGDGINDVAEIKAGLNEDGKIMFMRNTEKMQEFIVKSNEIVTYKWDGANAGEGIYNLLISGKDKAFNRIIDSPDNLIKIILDKTPPQVLNFYIIKSNISPNDDGYNDTSAILFKIRDNYCIEVIMDLSVYNQDNVLIRNLVKNKRELVEYHIFEWDGKDNYGRIAADGQYKIKLRVSDLAGNQTIMEKEIIVDVKKPADPGSIKLSHQYFSPNNDGIQDSTGIKYRLNEDSYVSVSIIDKFDNVINIYPDDKLEEAGEHIKSWNGLDNYGTLLEDDNYIVKVRIKDLAGNTVEKSLPVVIDTIPPQAIINSPAEGEEIEGIFNIVGTADDDNFKNYSIDIAGDEYNNYKGSIFTVFKVNDTLITWDTGFLNGQYSITLEAKDLAGNKSSSSVNINLINDPSTTILSVRLLSRNFISQDQEKVTYYFKLRTDANIDILIKNESGDIVKNVFQNIPFTAGDFIFSWNGTNDNEQEVIDGKYKIEIKAVNSENVENIKFLSIIIDKTPPQIIVNSPADDDHVKGLLEINGDIIDPNLYEYIVEYGLGETPPGYIFVNRRHKVAQDSILARIDTVNLLNDLYKLKIRAKDICGNESIREIMVKLDNKPPKVDLIYPEENQLISGVSVEIQGTAFDENLESYKLEYAAMANPDLWQTITVNFESVITNNLGTWTLDSLEGNFIIKLTAIDKAGNNSVLSRNITIDNLAPIVEIVSPDENSLITKNIPVVGTVYDDDIMYYVVEYGEGEMPGTWNIINNQQTIVKNGNLAIWNTSELNGLFTIRLSAFDRSGNSSEIYREVNIDNTRPSVYLINPKANSKNKGNINVKWLASDNYGIYTNILQYQDINRDNPPVIIYQGDAAEFNWDIAGLNGKYYLKVISEDLVNNTGSDEIIIKIDNTAPVIENLSVYPSVFHPQSQIKLTIITFDISENAKITIDILNSSGQIVRNLINQYPYPAGVVTEIWNGLNNNGGIVAEEKYTIRIYAVDETGNTAVIKTTDVIISGDVLPPVVKDISASPNPFSPNNDGIKDVITIYYNLSDNVYSYINTTIQIYNYIGDEVRELISNKSKAVGDNTETWDGKNNSNSLLPDGIYYYKITAADGAGNITIVSDENYSITLDTTKPVVYISSVDTEIISPNGDGYLENTEIAYYISDNFTGYNLLVDVVVKDTNNNIIKVLYDDSIQIIGTTYYIKWDGKSDSGDIVNDGIYYISITSIDKAGNISQEEKVEIGVDLTPPITTYSIGEPHYYYNDLTPILISSETPILFSAVDPIINGYSSGVAKGQYFIHFTNDIEPIIETNWIDFKTNAVYIYGEDGDYAIYYRSIDFASNIEHTNQEQRKIIVRLDNTPPELDIISPPAYCWINGNINIIGTVKDIHLDWYMIEYESKMGTNIIQPETQNQIENDILGIWQTSGLQEGWYKILLTAQDRVENTSEIYIDLVVGTPKFISSFGKPKELNKPMYIAEDTSGNLYLTDENNKRIRKYSSDGEFINELSIDVNYAKQPQGIAVDSEDNIYIVGHHSITKYDSTGNRIWKRKGLNQPMGVKISSDGFIWIADRNNDQIVKYSKEGEKILTIQDFTVSGIQDGFNKPSDLDFDNKGNIYIVDSGNNRIILLNTTNNSLEADVLGECCIGTNYFNKPEGISIKYIMNIEQTDFPIIYISDRNNDVVKCFDKYGNLLNIFGGNGNQEGKFNKPEGILVTFTGVGSSQFPYIYVVDRNNNRVQKFGLPDYGQLSTQTNKSQTNKSFPAKIEKDNKIQTKVTIHNNIIEPGYRNLTTITYSLEDTKKVRIKVYNIRGDLIKVLADEIKSSGTYKLNWDGKDSNGNIVSSGLYLIRVNLGDKVVETKKVIVIK